MLKTLVDISGIIGVIIAVLSAVISVYFSRQAEKSATKQLSVDVNNFQLEYFRDLRAWADEVVEVISEAGYLCEFNVSNWGNDELSKRQYYLRHRLSALTDRGRWFLPNVQEDKAGTEKEAAFRGFRQSPLGTIIRVHNLVPRINLEDSGLNSKLKEDIFDEKRKFVSEIQVILDPRTREQEFKKIIANK